VNDPITVWVGSLVTLVVLSYLIRDNVVYRLVQHAALGAAVGIGLVLLWQQVLWPRWAMPMSQGIKVWRTQGFSSEAYGALWILALIPGGLWYFQLSRKYANVSTLITGLFVGAAAGLALKYQTLLILPQISASIRPLNPAAGGEVTGHSIAVVVNNFLFLLILFTALLYFFFSIRTDNALLRPPLRFGRLAIMVCLGAMFGGTVLTRLAYLLERITALSEFARDEVYQRAILGGLHWVGFVNR
jgi:hypothetical protein